MHRLFTILPVLALAVPCGAADEPKPNTLTPKEIAEGWILLFDGETTFGWDAGGKPIVREGVLIHRGDQDVHASTTTTFRHYELKLEYLIDKTAKDAGSVTWQPTPYKEISHTLPHHKGWASARLEVEDGGISGSTSPITEKKIGVVIDREGKGFVITTTPKLFATPRQIVFDIPKGNRLSLRNIKLKPFGSKSLFNGKDLTSWKEFPGKKSTFTVTKEGWLSIKNGPGDLQTTAEWADFVLQLDCRTNGDNLNSGVFFRCIPGQYQNGYEAQIQNQGAKQPKTYIIEGYDPKTHQIAYKKAIGNWSRDYGTGAIYRRIPARRAVAKDREWFTMTVVAQGRHIATWVNGIQVVDWDDNRPENENARNGCRLKKGPISLQGHDPTTDLNFRNIRIADWNEKH